MKTMNIFRSLAVLAVLLLSSCANESDREDTMAVSFDVEILSELTKSGTPFDDGSGTFRLYVAAFSKADGKLYASSHIGGEGYEPVATLSDGSASISIRLPRNQAFRVVFFAEHGEAYDVAFADGPQAAFSFKSGLKANDPALDAFYAVQDVTSANTSYDVTLKRPFAQVNVLAPTASAPIGQTTFSSSFSVQAPTRFDLYNGAAGTSISTIGFADNAIAADAFGEYADPARPYTWIGTVYVLVPETGKVNVTSFRESGMLAPMVPGEIPVSVNDRTNLVGDVYGLDLSFSVLIDSGFADNINLYPILKHTVTGCYLSDHKRQYVSGTDQMVREYDGHALTFVLMDPGQDEQMVVSGYADTMQPGDVATMSVCWTKGSSTLLDRSGLMYVLKDEGGLVWIADDGGNGFIIKK